jgi:hypothetical protein
MSIAIGIGMGLPFFQESKHQAVAKLSTLSSANLFGMYDLRPGFSVVTPTIDGTGPSVDKYIQTAQLGGFVSDLSGNNRHLTSPDVGSRPNYFNRHSTNGLPYIHVMAGKYLRHVAGAGIATGSSYLCFVVGYATFVSYTSFRTSIGVFGPNDSAAWRENYTMPSAGAASGGAKRISVLGVQEAVTPIAGIGDTDNQFVRPFVLAWRSHKTTALNSKVFINGFQDAGNQTAEGGNPQVFSVGARFTNAATAYPSEHNFETYLQFMSVVHGDALLDSEVLEVSTDLYSKFRCAPL